MEEEGCLQEEVQEEGLRRKFSRGRGDPPPRAPVEPRRLPRRKRWEEEEMEKADREEDG
jgi:hypothetical protein